MENFKRPFNRGAYSAVDKKDKDATIHLMLSKGYEIVGNPDEENFKKYDLKFLNKENGKYISIENETRQVFAKLRDFFKTIHIPIRKAGSEADYYIIWSPDCQEMAICEMSIVKKYVKDAVDVVCDGKHYGKDKYMEKFIDVPKSEFKFLKKDEIGVWLESGK